MSAPTDDLLAASEQALRERFEKKSKTMRVPSTAHAPRDERIDRHLLPDEERPRMPFTQGKYLKRENPRRVQWERELRKFLRLLSPEHEHRIAAVHVYEWATGLSLAALMQAEKDGEPTDVPWRSDVRHLNALLREYFGKPYMTYIMGRKVKNAFRVPKGHYIYRRRPLTLTLYAEWAEGAKL